MFLPTRVITQTLPFIQSMTLHLHALVTLSQISTSYTNSSGSTLPKLNIDTKFLLISDDSWHQNSRLEATCILRLNFSIQPNPPRNYPISSLGHTKSLCSLALSPSPYNFLTVSM